MKVELKIDESFEETKVVIYSNKLSDEINILIKKLSEENPDHIIGHKDETIEIIEQKDILRIYSALGKVYLVTSTQEYLAKYRLYELEEILNKNFIRISNSEIINLKKVKNFDLSLSGTIYVTFINNSSTYVSRRYINKIKSVLGI